MAYGHIGCKKTDLNKNGSSRELHTFLAELIIRFMQHPTIANFNIMPSLFPADRVGDFAYDAFVEYAGCTE
jgi:hypothetical protein